MAIKKLRLSFDVPIQDLLALVATRNDALHIDVVADGKPDKMPKQLRNGAAVAGLLAAPKFKREHSRQIRAQDEYGPLTTYNAVAIFLMRANDHTGKAPDIKAALASLGVNPVSVSPQLSKMRSDGSVKQMADGVYKLTASGVHRFEKMMKEREAAKGVQA